MTNRTDRKTVETVLDDLTVRLEKTSDTPGLDAQVVLAHLLEKPRSWVMAHPEVGLSGERVNTLENMVARLESKEPLPYVLGQWEFFGLDFEVSAEVLIPRPETELLVERAISWLQAHLDCDQAADIGTGSGCIGITLAKHVSSLYVTATDISAAALEIARRNAAMHGVVKQIDFIQQDLFPQEGEYDLIVSNLPYIPTKKLRRLPVYGREPEVALDGGPDGLDLVRRLLAQAPERLRKGGLLLMEIEASCGPAVISLACDIFRDVEIHMHKDLAGRDRLLEIQA